MILHFDLFMRHLPVQIYYFILLTSLLLPVQAQVIVTGNIHNAADSLPLPNVAVVNKTLKQVTYTNLRGQFAIPANRNDTLEFSFIGFESQSGVVTAQHDFFRIFLQKKVYVLPDVDIISRNHKKDSIALRKEYQRAFDWKPVQWDELLTGHSSASGGYGVGISIDALYRALQFRKIALMRRFQATLIRDEQDRFIDYKFTPELVTNLTGLSGEQLAAFMKKYRPAYYFLLQSNEYDFYSYIKAMYREFIRNGDTRISTGEK